MSVIAATLTDLYELLERQFAVHVLVHLAEDLVSPLLGGGLVLGHLHHRTHLDRIRVIGLHMNTIVLKMVKFQSKLERVKVVPRAQKYTFPGDFQNLFTFFQNTS